MKVVVTGGAGFLGQLLAEHIIADGFLALPGGERIGSPRIVLADGADAVIGDALAGKVESVALDVRDAAAVGGLIDAETRAVFHLAAVVSAAAEADFDLGIGVNLDGTRNVLEAARALERFVPVVATSSLAVFGGDLPARLGDGQVIQPENSYGAQKAIGEMLCADYRRKGFCDTRTLRLPTVVIRPGRSNAAASSFASSILREPLNGKRAICPVKRDLKLWIGSPESTATGLLRAMSTGFGDWPKFGVVNLPGLSTSVGGMLDALERKAGRDASALVDFQFDPGIDAIVGSWPSDFDTSIAEALGFATDTDVDALIDGYTGRYLLD